MSFESHQETLVPFLKILKEQNFKKKVNLWEIF